MKKGINQSEGINQVALINSNDNQVTIINSPTDYMSRLVKNGKIEEAVEVFRRFINKLNSYIHCIPYIHINL